MIRIFFGALFLSSSALGFSLDINEYIKVQNEELRSSASQLAGQFFLENYSKAFDILREQSILSDQDLNRLAVQFPGQFDNVKKLMGEKIDLNLVNESNIGDFFVRFDYFVRYQRGAMHFFVVFYKNDTRQWKIAGFNFDDKFLDGFLFKSNSKVLNIFTVKEKESPKT